MPGKMRSQIKRMNAGAPISAKIGSNVTISEYCYLTFIAIFSLLKAFGFYEGQTIFNVGMVIAFCFVLLKIITTPMNGKEWLAVILLLAMGGIVYLNTGEKSLLVICAFLAGMKGVSSDRLVKTCLVCWGMGFVLLTLFTLLGLHSDMMFMRNKHGIGYVICHSLGYPHSNVLHINYLCICAMVLFLARRYAKKQKMVLLAILAGIDLYIFLYSMSYTGLIGSFAFYSFYVYFTFRHKLSIVEKALINMVLPFCLLFSLVGPLVIRGKLFDVINNALTTRYELTRWFLTTQPITLLGTHISVPNYRYTLDCSYAYLFVRLGIIPFTILMMLYFCTIQWLVKEERRTELSIILGLCVTGVTEPFLFNLSFKNVTLVFVGEWLFCVLAKPHFVGDETDSKAFTIMSLQKFSSKKISHQILLTERLIHKCNAILKEWFFHGRKYLVIFFATMLFAAVVSALSVKPVNTVYISEDINQKSFTNREYCYLSQEEVLDKRSEGDIIYGYTGRNDRMFPFSGSAAHIEYIRIIVSYAIWTGMCASTIIGAFYSGGNETKNSNKKVANRTTGSK